MSFESKNSKYVGRSGTFFASVQLQMKDLLSKKRISFLRQLVLHYIKIPNNLTVDTFSPFF